jgi:hypothetical protein
LIRLSSDPVMRREEVKETERMGLEWAGKVETSWPVSASKRVTYPVSEATASKRPSLLYRWERGQIFHAPRLRPPNRAHVFNGAAEGARSVHRGQLFSEVLQGRRKNADASFRAGGSEVEVARVEGDGPGLG